MKILITSPGQIGTNLALRLLRGGHEVFGIDKRQNTWTDEFPYLLQDLAGYSRRSPAGSTASSTWRPTWSSTSPPTPNWPTSRGAIARSRTR